MHQLTSFYTNRILRFNTELSKVKRKLIASSMARLAVFIAAGIGIYILFGNTRWIVIIIIMAIVLFLFLVTRHHALQYQRDKLQAIIKINETEIDVLNRNFNNLPQGDQYINSSHHFSHDIDLFGNGSFYQYANRTSLRQGSDYKADLLTANSIAGIPDKQNAVKELAEMVEWRQQFSAEASLSDDTLSTDSIVKWLEDYQPFVPKVLKWLPMAFSVVSIALGVLYILDLIPMVFLNTWLLVGIGISAVYLKKITQLSSTIGKIQSAFSQYYKLLERIEETEFDADLLNKEKNNILNENERTSAILKYFSKLLNGLDQNNNVFYLFFANGYFLRTLSHCYKIEQWIRSNRSRVEGWFGAVAFFDAYNSLGNFAFNHPNYSYPAIVQNQVVLKSASSGHPLLDPEKSILNNYQIHKDQFFIITGANMAGKSTFLRAVSLQIVMANVGLPVCAESTEYTPVKLITSMRTSDSLKDDESYFFSELKRLKFIVDEIKTDAYFIVLDEILKGTNSADKAKGSKQFIEKLVESNSTGIIATHDLSLCEVADALPQVENYYFDADITNDELTFDYKFKKGICQNMNASFLLKKMGIVDS